jgi:hypothetical protein
MASTIEIALKKYNLNDKEIRDIVRDINECTATNEEDLNSFLEKLDPKHTEYKHLLELSIRKRKLIPYSKLTDVQAIKMFMMISPGMAEKDWNILNNYFHTEANQEIDISSICEILVKRMKNGMYLECLSLLKYVSCDVDFQERDEKEILPIQKKKNKRSKRKAIANGTNTTTTSTESTNTEVKDINTITTTNSNTEIKDTNTNTNTEAKDTNTTTTTTNTNIEAKDTNIESTNVN